MSEKTMWLFGVVFCLFAMQALGAYLQIRAYRKAVRRLHKKGNVGIGQKRGGWRSGFSGHLVLIACDSNGVITGGEVMEGISLLASFKPLEKFLDRPLVGARLEDFLQEFQSFDEKQRKRYRGYIQAFEALEMRLHPKEQDGEASTEPEN